MNFDISFSGIGGSFDAVFGNENLTFSPAFDGSTSYTQPYTGDYTVTPEIDRQVLGTSGKKMTSDLTILGIPKFEVTNPQGGKTFIIGGVNIG